MNSIKKILLSSALFASSLSFGAISNPVTGEETIQGDEVLDLNTVMTVDTKGTLNIGSDMGAGSLSMSYDKVGTMFTNKGILNIGTDSAAGAFNFNSSFSGTLVWSPQAFTNTGTINIGSQGVFNMTGRSFIQYGNYMNAGKVNVYGQFNVNTTTNSYVNVNSTMNIYEGGSLDIKGSNLSINNGGVLNFLGGTYVSKTQIRMTGTTGGSIYMGSENVLQGVTIQLDGVSSTTKGAYSYIKTGDFSQTIGEFRFGCTDVTENGVVVKKFGSTTDLTLSETKNVAKYFKIVNVSSYNGGGKKDFTTYLNIENFVNDFVLIDADVTVTEGNKLYLSSLNMTIEVNAYLGLKDGAALDGEWSLVHDDVSGLNYGKF